MSAFRSLIVCISLVIGTAAYADTLSLDYWNGKSPMTQIRGYTLFGIMATWGDSTASPILLDKDRAPGVNWGTASTIELTDSAPFLGNVHLQDGLYFTECQSSRCSLNDPDTEWVVGNEGLRFHIYIAEKSWKENRVVYCAYSIGVNGPFTGSGFGQWSCFYGPTGRMSLFYGSPSQNANAIYKMIDRLSNGG